MAAAARQAKRQQQGRGAAPRVRPQPGDFLPSLVQPSYDGRAPRSLSTEPQMLAGGGGKGAAAQFNVSHRGHGGGGIYGSSQHIGGLETALAKAHKEIARLRGRSKHAEGKNRKLSEELEQKDTLVQRESGRHERFATLIKAAETENRRLKHRLEQVERRSLDDVRQLELTVSSMEEECHSLRLERDALAEELAHLREQHGAIEFRAKRRDMDHGALVKALALTKGERSALDGRVRELSTELGSVSLELRESRDELRASYAEAAQLRRDAAQVQEAELKRRRAVEGELGRLQTEAETLRAQQQCTMEQQQRTSADDVQALRSELAAVTAALDDARKQAATTEEVETARRLAERQEALRRLLQSQELNLDEKSRRSLMGVLDGQTQPERDPGPGADDQGRRALERRRARDATRAQELARLREEARRAEVLWREAFNRFDVDGSGEIDKGELRKVMKQLGVTVTDAQAQGMLQEADSDGNGSIDFGEFRRIVAKTGKSKLWYDAATKSVMESATKIQNMVRKKIIVPNRINHNLMKLTAASHAKTESGETKAKVAEAAAQHNLRRRMNTLMAAAGKIGVLENRASTKEDAARLQVVGAEEEGSDTRDVSQSD
jgi:hypothetical protein